MLQLVIWLGALVIIVSLIVAIHRQKRELARWRRPRTFEAVLELHDCAWNMRLAAWRMRDQWSESSAERQNELWRELHKANQDLNRAITNMPADWRDPLGMSAEVSSNLPAYTPPLRREGRFA